MSLNAPQNALEALNLGLLTGEDREVPRTPACGAGARVSWANFSQSERASERASERERGRERGSGGGGGEGDGEGKGEGGGGRERETG